MPSRIFLVNVGVNASHRVKSPLFPDGTFELLPIPEERRWWAPTLPAYPKLERFNTPGESLALYVPERYRNVRVHHDPEFETFTYGDNPNTSPRAAGLKAAGPGDCLFFLARLVPWLDGRFHDEPGFYLVGYLEIEEVLKDVIRFPSGREFQVFGANAHVRRAAYHPKALDGFWVWKGSPSSRRLRYAVPLTRELCDATLRDANGEPWRWDAGRSDLQVIGSYTRAARLVIDPSTPDGREQAERWWRAVAERNGAVRTSR
ncbi:MAG: hypothetical protein HY685_04975 [Chloroflexi bacterium]|nr:hypothetical protein [Chloroflexota bacterium]